jgi:hypothetical protein
MSFPGEPYDPVNASLQNLDTYAMEFTGTDYAQMGQFQNRGLFGAEEVRAIPREVLDHIPAGPSVIEEGSQLEEESGRSYHGYEAGKYFLPNDPVSHTTLLLEHWLNVPRQSRTVWTCNMRLFFFSSMGNLPWHL